MSIHDLHREFCKQAASGDEEKQEGHQGLLDRRMPFNQSVSEKHDDNDDQLGLMISDYTPGSWWEDSTVRREYTR